MPRDFWLSCGHHLLDRNVHGYLSVTDDLLRLYLARPEVFPTEESCAAERDLHTKLLSEPRSSVSASEVAVIADADARENWQLLLAWRDHLLRHDTLEVAYQALVAEGRRFPPLFIDQIVQAILRNILDDCADVFVLKAAELFFRAQRLAVSGGSLLAVDTESASQVGRSTPLGSLLGLTPDPGIEVLNEDNAMQYFERSDAFDFALDLTAGRRGLAALGEVIARWLKHLLKTEVDIKPMLELRDAALSWYVGLDATASRIGDTLWRGQGGPQSPAEFIVGLFRLEFKNESDVVEDLRGQPVYLILAATSDMTLRLKPQNLLNGLPINAADEVLN